MQILQITDTHLYGTASGKLRGVETDPSLRATLDEAFARVPNYAAVLVTGDLVQDDKSGYLRFRSFFGGLAKPVLCIPGNHDEPEAMRRELTGEPFKICGSHTIGDWTFVMLDSYDPGRRLKVSGASSTGMRMFERWFGATFTKLSTASAAMCACLRRHPPARSFCRKAIATRWTRLRRPTAASNCTQMDVSTLKCTG